MGNLIKIIVVMLCIDIMLYLGGFTLIEGDILQRFFSINADGDVTQLSSNISDAIPQGVVVAGIDTSDDFRITDIPRTLLDLFLVFVNIIAAPIALFSAPQLSLPLPFRLMFGVPITIIFLIVVVDWFRGHD